MHPPHVFYLLLVSYYYYWLASVSSFSSPAVARRRRVGRGAVCIACRARAPLRQDLKVPAFGYRCAHTHLYICLDSISYRTFSCLLFVRGSHACQRRIVLGASHPFAGMWAQLPRGSGPLKCHSAFRCACACADAHIQLCRRGVG